MLEIFVVYLWEHKLLQMPLLTDSGETIEVLFPGIKNSNSGPDFLDARIKIGGILWVGNVEMHINASDWYKHQHHVDNAYDNVVLHVVFEADKQVLYPNGNAIPTLSVKGKFDPQILLMYRKFIDSSHFIACQNHVDSVQRFTWLSWLDRMATERLQEKVTIILEMFQHCGNDWEETFYQLLLKNYGLKVNDVPFHMLAKKLPFNLLLKHANRLDQLEALLYGVAGMLDEPFTDDYPQMLRKEYSFLKHKYNLQSLNPNQWRFMRMRPSNFPTIRLSQFAALVHANGRIFSKILNASDASEIANIFDVHASPYWENHYRFDTHAKPKTKQLGKLTAELMMINSVAQVLFAYGIYADQALYRDQSMMLLESIPAENNAIVRGFHQIGISINNALQSQALIHLKRNYCDARRCLECRIGHLLIKSRGEPV